MIEVISFFALIWFVAHLIFFANLKAGTSIDEFNFFNPIRNYRTWTSMNWFGVILGTVFLHILLPVYAIVYWFYKLCTFGRKQEKE